MAEMVVNAPSKLWCGFPSMSSDEQVRSFLESLTTWHTSAADVMDQVEFKGSRTLLTLAWSEHSSARSDGHVGSRLTSIGAIDGYGLRLL